MPDRSRPQLSRRERQIMDVLYRLERASAGAVMSNLADPPSYSAVRALLRVLEEKGHVKHVQDGPRYIYLPTVTREKARQSAMQQLVRTFFGGSTEQAVAALLDMSPSTLSAEELERLSQLIELARKEGR
jgi:predicted transcriptional regulator